MVHTVHISKHALNYFRQKARNSPNEEYAYLLGEVLYPDKIIVDSFYHPKEFDLQTPFNVQPSAEDYTKVRLLAEEQGKRIVGDIHSHPNAAAIMSEPDYRGCLEDGFHVCGIVGVIGRKTDVRFWIINSALPCEISYEEIKGTSESA